MIALSTTVSRHSMLRYQYLSLKSITFDYTSRGTQSARYKNAVYQKMRFMIPLFKINERGIENNYSEF